MKQHSKIINCDTRDDCKPWHAPQLDASEDDIFDYKLTDPEHITHREQQQKIRQQAYEKSYAKGYMEGIAQGRREIGEQAEHLQALMASLTMPLDGLDDQVVDELVQLCMFIVKQMVRRELKTAPDEIIAVVKETLNLLPVTAADVKLELHPEDAALVRKVLSHANSEASSSWRIVEEPLLTRGGCQVLSSTSRIDATVETRINTVIASVLGDERKRG